jgi:hypothetical protein
MKIEIDAAQGFSASTAIRGQSASIRIDLALEQNRLYWKIAGQNPLVRGAQMDLTWVLLPGALCTTPRLRI